MLNHLENGCNRATLELMRRHPGRFLSITADNGTEFHADKDLEMLGGVIFYFATPHHSWERGTNENTNGLIRQYLPKATSRRTLCQKRRHHRRKTQQPTEEKIGLQNTKPVLP